MPRIHSCRAAEAALPVRIARGNQAAPGRRRLRNTNIQSMRRAWPSSIPCRFSLEAARLLQERGSLMAIACRLDVPGGDSEFLKKQRFDLFVGWPQFVRVPEAPKCIAVISKREKGGTEQRDRIEILRAQRHRCFERPARGRVVFHAEVSQS